MSESERRQDLLRDVSSRSATRRFGAAKRLRDEDPDFAIPLLQELLTGGPTIRVTREAAGSLQAMDQDRARMVLVQALDHPHDWVRLMAAEQLAKGRDPRARPVLEAALGTDDIDQFGPAVEGICRYGDTEARQTLERAVGDPEAIPLLREIASGGLLVLGTRESLPALQSALASKNSDVRRTARDAIEAIEERERRSAVGNR